MSGTKQFALEAANFLVNFILMSIVWAVGILVYLDIVDRGLIKYSKDAAVPFNWLSQSFSSYACLFRMFFSGHSSMSYQGIRLKVRATEK